MSDNSSTSDTDDGWYVSKYSLIKDEKLLGRPIFGGKTALHRWPRTGVYEKTVHMFEKWGEEPETPPES